MYLSALPACLPVHHEYVWWQTRKQESIRFPGTHMASGNNFLNHISGLWFMAWVQMYVMSVVELTSSVEMRKQLAGVLSFFPSCNSRAGVFTCSQNVLRPWGDCSLEHEFNRHVKIINRRKTQGRKSKKSFMYGFLGVSQLYWDLSLISEIF